MGIPHLITHLQPYAESVPLTGVVVIDGPAFAHHIFHLCLKNRPWADSPVEAAPTYEELGFTAIKWLEAIEGSGISIKKIYFDGYLPSSKLETRLERLRSSTQRLTSYHTNYPIPCKVPVKIHRLATRNLFTSASVQAKLTALPALPFLVPAVLDALLASPQFSEITSVMPGEADLYCAQYLKVNGGIVFTGDSDLLVHELGQDGAVTFFKDIVVDKSPERLRAQLYKPSLIAGRLKLSRSDGLGSLAFEIMNNKHETLPKLLNRAVARTAIASDPKGYGEFCKEYKSLPENVVSVTEFSQCLQGMDPRISEYVLQYRSIAEAVGQVTAALGTSRIFLPFLHDCPARTAAWEMSTSVRQLAYGLVNIIVPDEGQKRTVFEHRRQQMNSIGKELELPTLSQLSPACEFILIMFDNLREALPEISEPDFWIAVAIYQDVEWSHLVGKLVNSEVVIKQLAHIQDPNRGEKYYTWDTLHLLAQMQGSYYSFRMLKQITDLLISSDSSRDVPDEVIRLHGQLQALPALHESDSVAQDMFSMRKDSLQKMLNAARKILKLESAKVESAAKSRKKKRKKKNAAVERAVDATFQKNPFALLGNE
ncbi:XPG domain containing-domain-containing protein [Bisporella sp. PMI_857]|nr:XPG domain containing-domain-containing protein [Bisporella sp. PMI_857]